MVCKAVTKEVPVCDNVCDACPCDSGGGLFSRLFGRKGGGCCGTSVSCGCCN